MVYSAFPAVFVLSFGDIISDLKKKTTLYIEQKLAIILDGIE